MSSHYCERAVGRVYPEGCAFQCGECGAWEALHLRTEEVWVERMRARLLPTCHESDEACHVEINRLCDLARDGLEWTEDIKEYQRRKRK